MTQPPNRGGMVPVEAVAALFNLSARRIQQLAKEGVIPKAERGQYNLAGSVRGYIAFLQKSIDAAKAKSAQPVIVDLQRERARKTAAEAELAELEVAKARGEWVAVSEFRQALQNVLEKEMARLRALPIQLSWLGVDVERAIDEEVERIVAEMSTFDEDVITPPDDTGGEAQAA
jgi:phage terminase Nu1 subunit (DNA packaging protein)